MYMAPEVRLCSAGRTRITGTVTPYGCACDWFSLGTMLYELVEKAFPFGRNPRFKNMEEEFRKPNLLDWTSVTPHDMEDEGDGEGNKSRERSSVIPAYFKEVDHADDLYDLLAGLLDWEPNERLQGDAVKQHPYWRSSDGEAADWELVDGKRQPSPLKHLVRERVAARRAEAKRVRHAGGDTEARMTSRARSVAKELSNAAAMQAAVDDALEEDTPEPTKDLEEMMHMEETMRVDGWEFSSPYAIAREYMESNKQVVTVL
mmetsp:Transcript_69204/g.137241  ORF Transcript_69204/g.137241 Transcript_69204/m.137241 type:complete len:260 (-) Transcript_69204:290-1069(-)